MAKNQKVGIIGSGFIGHSWAMLFAGAGYEVVLYDVDLSKVDAALKQIKEQLENLEKNGMLRGTLSAKEQFSLIKKAQSLADCMKDCIHVQECVFEKLELKQEIFKKMDEFASDTVVLCSSTSCFPSSSFSENLKHKSQVMVAHPVNPPYYVPLVELIPAPWTNPSLVTRTRALMCEIGQKPVTLKKEVLGFALNRLQYAIMDEAWRLVQNGVMSVEDVDTTMSEGLGMRYAFIGVLETAHLNADGMLDYMDRYAQGIYNVSETFGPNPMMLGPVAEEVHKQMCKKVPLDKLAERRKWRDNCLASLSKLKRETS